MEWERQKALRRVRRSGAEGAKMLGVAAGIGHVISVSSCAMFLKITHWTLSAVSCGAALILFQLRRKPSTCFAI